METTSLKSLAELFTLASQFFDEAAELITARVRRDEILGIEPKRAKPARTDEPKDAPKKDKPEEILHNPEKKEKAAEKKNKSAEKKEKADENLLRTPEKKDKAADKKITESKEKPDDAPEKPKKEKSKKKTEKIKSGLKMFMDDKIKQLKKSMNIKESSIGEYYKAIKAEWDGITSSEREIWNEKALEASEIEKIVEILPQKTPRSEESKKKRADEEDQSSESLKKKKIN